MTAPKPFHRRIRSADTVEGAAQAFISAAKGLPIPPKQAPIRPKDQPFWEAIVSLRDRDDWSEVHLVAAAQLARTQADIIGYMEQMDSEEPVVYTGPNDIPKPNPLLTVLEQATRRQLALMRTLGLAALDAVGDVEKRQQTLKAARQASARAEASGLLA